MTHAHPERFWLNFPVPSQPNYLKRMYEEERMWTRGPVHQYDAKRVALLLEQVQRGREQWKGMEKVGGFGKFIAT